MGVASAIPYVGTIALVHAFVYLLGYVLLSIRQGMQDPSPATPALEEAGEASEAATIDAIDVQADADAETDLFAS